MGRPRYDPEAIAMNRIIAVLASLEDAACGRVVRHLAERYAVADAIAGTTVRATWQVPPGYKVLSMLSDDDQLFSYETEP